MSAEVGGVDLHRALRRAVGSGGLAVLIMAAAIFLVARSETFGEAMLQLVQRARPGPIAAAVIVMSSAFLFLGFRWKALLPARHRPPVLGLSAALCSGLLLNYALPGPMGELSSAWLVERRYRVPLAQGLASSIAGRVIGLSTAALLAGSVYLLARLPVPPEYERMVGLASAVIAAAGMALALLAARPSWWTAASASLAARFTGDGRVAGLVHKVDRGVVHLADALGNVRTLPVLRFVQASGWAICGHLAVTTGVAMAAWSFGADVSYAGLLFTYTLTTAGAVVLFAFPGFHTGWDALFVALLVGTSGLDMPTALMVAAVVRSQHLALVVVGGMTTSWLISGSEEPDRSAGVE